MYNIARLRITTEDTNRTDIVAAKANLNYPGLLRPASWLR
jgi:hypothetical protein